MFQTGKNLYYLKSLNWFRILPIRLVVPFVVSVVHMGQAQRTCHPSSMPLSPSLLRSPPLRLASLPAPPAATLVTPPPHMPDGSLSTL
jgi:hypothetical protein